MKSIAFFAALISLFFPTVALLAGLYFLVFVPGKLPVAAFFFVIWIISVSR